MDNPDHLYDESVFHNYFNVETEAMAAPGYLESKKGTLRGIAVKVIVQNSESDKPDAFIPYLALHYFDRFISRNPLPNVLGNVNDNVVLAAICCLAISWKMRHQSFSFSEFLEKRNLNREYQDQIVVMELHILNGLNWKMRPAIPTSFVSFFIQNSTAKGIRRRVVDEIIIEAQDDIFFTQFKPSVIAASAVILACRLLVREENVRMQSHLRCRLKFIEELHVKEADLDACNDKMLHMCVQKKMYMEGVEEFMEDQLLKIAGASHAGEASTSSSHRSGNELRPVREPKPVSKLRQIREEPETETGNEARMNFELKWQLVADETQGVTIDSTDSGRNDDEAENKYSLHGKCGNCPSL